MRVAITGASGYIGSALTDWLESHGHEVRQIVRGPESDAAAQWDPARGWVRAGAFDGMDAVVHLSGVSIAGKRWTSARRALLRSSRIDSTVVLAGHLAAMSQPPKVLITMSGAGYYGDAGEAQLSEDSFRGSGFLADLVADWEAAAATARAAGIRVVHARTAPVIGPDSELLRRLLLPFRLGLGGRLGSGRQWFSWISTQDLVRALEFALATPALDGPVNVVAPGPVRNSEFTKALGRQLRRPTIFPIPAFALRLLFGPDLASETLLVSQRALPAALESHGFVFEQPSIDDALAVALGRRPAADVQRGLAR
ncbi:MAG: TIGR01777 family oxidoreductase [Dehalococcoidia bacterium]